MHSEGISMKPCNVFLCNLLSDRPPSDIAFENCQIALSHRYPNCIDITLYQWSSCICSDHFHIANGRHTSYRIATRHTIGEQCVLITFGREYVVHRSRPMLSQCAPCFIYI